MHECLYLSGAQGDRGGLSDSLELEFKWLLAAVWVPGAEPGSSKSNKNHLSPTRAYDLETRCVQN